MVEFLIGDIFGKLFVVFLVVEFILSFNFLLLSGVDGDIKEVFGDCVVGRNLRDDLLLVVDNVISVMFLFVKEFNLGKIGCEIFFWCRSEKLFGLFKK